MTLRKAGGNWIEGDRLVSGSLEDGWRARHAGDFLPFAKRMV